MATMTIPAATEANNALSTEHLMHKIHVEFDRAYYSGGFGSPFPPSDAATWLTHEDTEAGRAANCTWQPQIDIEDCGDALKFRCDLPGVHREHINVRLRGGRLVINGKRECEKTTDEGHVTRLTSFSRAFSLPDGVTPDDVHAEIGEGVLHVKVAKPQAMIDNERKEQQSQLARNNIEQAQGKTRHVGFAPEQQVESVVGESRNL